MPVLSPRERDRAGIQPAPQSLRRPAVVIAGAGHLAPLEQPATFGELLLGFLDGLTPRVIM